MIGLGLTAAMALAAPDAPSACAIELVVLGAGQDAGAPQIGNADDDGPRLLPSSLAVIDREGGARYLFDATPAITDQLAMLDGIEPAGVGLGLDGLFLTHAHIGHYLGLGWFGVEGANTDSLPVFAMPRMAEFLRANGPWSQLVELGNIALFEVQPDQLLPISDTFGVLPLSVPHRDEFSETVGFIIITPGKRALYVPDLDSWEEWEEASGNTLAVLLDQVDLAYVDATFWDDNELLDENGEGRDMSAIPHPRVTATMDRLADLPEEARAKLYFIHYNHTNPIRDPASEESAEVAARGFRVARRGDRHCLLGEP